MKTHTVKSAERAPGSAQYRGFETRASLLSSAPGAWLKIRPVASLTAAQMRAALGAESRRLAASEPAMCGKLLARREQLGLDRDRQDIAWLNSMLERYGAGSL